jgi:hypothetical protein
MFSGFLAPQGPKNIFFLGLVFVFFCETCLACNSSVYYSDPLVGVAKKIPATGTRFNQTSMSSPLGGVTRKIL